MPVLSSLLPNETKDFPPKKLEWKDVTFFVVPLARSKLEKFFMNSSISALLTGKDPSKIFDEKAFESFCELLANSSIVNWENLTDESGKPLKYDAGIMKQILEANPLLFNEIFSFVLKYTEEAENFITP